MQMLRLARDKRLPRILRRLALGALLLVGIALAAGFSLLGWVVNERFDPDVPAVTVVVDRAVTVVDEQESGEGVTPNVLGLGEAAARQALADAGIDPAMIMVRAVPYVGERGLVVEQSPPPGEQPDGTVDMSVSAEAKMEELVGLPIEDARAALTQLGAIATVVRRYEPGITADRVVATEPAAGEAITERVTLTVAEAPSSAYLSKLEPVASDCSIDTLNVGGRSRSDAIVCQPGEDSPRRIDYLLNKRIGRVDAVLGVSDRAATGAPVHFLVRIDGRAVESITTSFGAPRLIRVPVSGAVRLTIIASVPKSDPAGEQVEAVIADARVFGARSAVDALVASTSSP